MILENIASDGEVMNALKKVNDIRTQKPLIRSSLLCNVLHELSTLAYSTNDTVVAKMIRTLVFSPEILVCTRSLKTASFQWTSENLGSNQPGVSQISSLFQYKNVVDYKVLDYFSAYNTAEYKLISTCTTK